MISAKWKPPRKGSDPRSTARAAPSVITFPPLVAEVSFSNCAPGTGDGNGAHTGLNAAGDTLIHMLSTPAHACQVQMPDDVTVIARRAPIPLFGAGLVEAIPDETLLALEDPVDRDRDGISGRAAIIVDVASGQRRVGRLGWKAQHATLLSFGADAYRNEMGITNDVFPQEFAFGVSSAQMQSCDPFPDPEDRRDPRTGRRGIDNFESFMRFLAPVARSHVDETTLEGERLFSASWLRSMSCPEADDGAERAPGFQSSQRRSVLRSAAPRCGHGRRHSTGRGCNQARFAHRRCGVCASAGHFFTMAAR